MLPLHWELGLGAGDRSCYGQLIQRGSRMSLKTDILKILRDEGYRLNEAIDDALDEFITIVEEETEGAEDDMDENSYTDEED
jgi:hypothetical protein